MQKWLKYLIGLSFIFVAIFLFQSRNVEIPDVRSYSKLCISLLLVVSGFLIDSFTWSKALQLYGLERIRWRHGIVSNGMSVFGKYIPGKVWIIIGRAGIISSYGFGETKRISAISLIVQMISLWSGFLLGAFVVNSTLLSIPITIVIIGLWLFLTLYIFTSLISDFSNKLLSRIQKRKVEIPRITGRKALVLAPYSVMTWLSWSFGFWFLIEAFSGDSLPFQLGLIFATAGSLGIAAIIAPGGLGVREGLMVALLVSFGINTENAIVLSIISRLWFLIGEASIFFLAFLLRKLKRS
jgi:uncharacterized membrane protein YbhN (UPF0104 family)